MTENDFILFDRIEVIKKTIEKYGEENFYISFSGGKDSTVLHHLIDEAIPGNNPYLLDIDNPRKRGYDDKEVVVLQVMILEDGFLVEYVPKCVYEEKDNEC